MEIPEKRIRFSNNKKIFIYIDNILNKIKKKIFILTIY